MVWGVLKMRKLAGGSIKRESATPDYRVVITIPNDLSKGRDAQ